MKVLIGAIGIGKYEGTRYQFEDGSIEDADYFLYALTRHIKPDHLMVISTKSATEKALPDLREWIELEKVPITVIDIPNGKDKTEAWSIFNAIITNYDELFPEGKPKPEVYIDITNGLRSIPLLMLSIVRYLQRSRKIDLKGIFYGAFDAIPREENPKPVYTPVYTMNPFITVLDWASAVDTFLTTGNSVQLAEMLETQAFISSPSDEVATALRKLSEALDIVQILAIHQCSHALVEAVKQARSSMDETPENTIIGGLLHQLQEEFEPLALSNPQDNLRKFLQKDLKLVLWYFKRNRYQDAILVAREWMLTYKMQHNSAKNQRKYSTDEMFSHEHRDRENKPNDWTARDKKDLHQAINELRNTLAHCGFTNSPTETKDQVDKIERILSQLQKLEPLL